MLKRHRVRLRRAYVRYRFRSTAAATGRWAGRFALIALGFWLTDAGGRFWRESPRFRVRSIHVPQNAPAPLARRLGVSAGDHIFGFSTDRLAARLQEEFPELSQVTVQRRLNRDVAVSVRWRVPIARIASEAGWLGIDATGTEFPIRENLEQATFLPVLAGVAPGDPVAPALRFLTALQALEMPWSRSLVKIEALSDGGEAVLYFKNGPPVFWGELAASGEFQRKAERLQRVLQDNLLKNGADYVRFVTADRIAVRLLSAPVKKAGKEMTTRWPSLKLS